VNYLLDTHTFIWMAEGSSRLPDRVRGALVDPRNEIGITVVSLWEMAIKASIGKLHVPAGLQSLEVRAKAERVSVIPIAMEAIYHVASMPFHHKDPFDRIIAATALTTGSVLVSADSIFDAYGVSRLW